MNDRCSTPGCKGWTELRYLGRDLCRKCWTKLCKQHDREELLRERERATQELIDGQDGATFIEEPMK